MNGVDFLESILAGNPITAPLIVASKVREGMAAKPPKTPETQAPATQAPVPKPSGESTTPDLPTQQPVPPGGASGAGLPGILETLIRLQTQEAQATREAQRKEAEAIREAQLREAQLAREYYPEKARIDIETYRQQADIASQAGMEKMRESTARQIELQTINAWQNITQAQINRDTAIGLGLMNLGYRGASVNPDVLQAGAAVAGQGRAGFGVPSSTIS